MGEPQKVNILKFKTMNNWIRQKPLIVGDIVCFQHEGYKTDEVLFSRNVYDHFTRKITAKWRIKEINHSQAETDVWDNTMDN